MKTARILVVPLLFVACSSPQVHEENPASPEFDVKGSDPRAIQIADEVMRAAGGRQAWDETRCVQWTFAGKRTHLWDKLTGDLRVDDGPRTVLMNVQSRQGRLFEGGSEVLREPDRKEKQLERAYEQWINDSYWLFLPFKLKDSGVTLGYIGERKLPDGRAADVLRLTFHGVGVTPDNKYEVWVAKDTHWVEQWSYFKDANDPSPTMTTPWTDWKPYGRLVLATGRGKGPAISNIAVFDAPPKRIVDPSLP
jgi:hypothetical protein